MLGYAASRGAARADDPELDQQAKAIEALCAERGWQLAGLVRDTDQPGRGLERPALAYLLERLADGGASCVVVTELERLCRSVAELGDILAALEQAGGRLVALEPELDTGSPAGQTAARALSAVSAWERQRLAERTRKGLAAARAKGAVSRPAVEDRPELKRRIISMRRAGMTLQAIADELNAEGVRTVRGGARWRPSSVQAALGYKRPVRTRTNGVDDRSQAEEPEM